MYFLRYFVLLCFFVISPAAFADISQSICAKPEINSSMYYKNKIAALATSLGSKSSWCGFYSEDSLTIDPTSKIPEEKRNNSGCREIQCRGANAEAIIANAKTAIEFSNQAIDGDFDISRKNKKQIKSGLKNFEKTLPQWEAFLSKPYSAYTYRDAEKYISRSLERITLKQASLLPSPIMDPYLEEQRRLAAEEERRLAAEEERRLAAEEERRLAAEEERQLAADEAPGLTAEDARVITVEDELGWEENAFFIFILCLVGGWFAGSSESNNKIKKYTGMFLSYTILILMTIVAFTSELAWYSCLFAVLFLGIPFGLGASKKSCAWCGENNSLKEVSKTEKGRSWEKANKDGSRDKRVKDNFESASISRLYSCKKCDAQTRIDYGRARIGTNGSIVGRTLISKGNTEERKGSDFS